MEWSIGFAALPFVGGLCLLFRRHQHKQSTTVSRQVRCPLYEEEATVQAQIKHGHSPHYTDITSCSLLCQGPFALESRMEWTPDMPYYAVHPLAQGESPVYEMEVSCRKTCLKTLDYAEKNNGWRERVSMSGVIDSAELAQRVYCRKNQTSSPLQAPWSYGV